MVRQRNEDSTQGSQDCNATGNDASWRVSMEDDKMTERNREKRDYKGDR